MADFTNTDDVIDVRDIISRVEELREQRKPRFVAGWNMPGYMPDSEPAEFDNAEDARAYIADAMGEGDIIEPATIDACRNGEGEYGATFGNYHYWVIEDGVIGLDDDETEELETLENLLKELKGCGGDEQWDGDWYPITLIRDSYFEDYAQELAEECGLVNTNANWPNNCIDWEKAARELQWDYSPVDFGNVTYWYR